MFDLMSTIRAHTGEGMTVSTHAELQDMAEFDHPFIVADDGTVSDALPEGVYAPGVYNDEDGGDIIIDSSEWEALTGYTGQYGYHGAVMHASEYIGGTLADDILSTPGVYVVVVVGSTWLDDEDGGNEPAGWAILRQVVES